MTRSVRQPVACLLAAALLGAGGVAAGPTDEGPNRSSAELGQATASRGSAAIPLADSVALLSRRGGLRYRGLPGVAEVPVLARRGSGFAVAWRDVSTAGRSGVFWGVLRRGRLVGVSRVAGLESGVEGPLAVAAHAGGARTVAWSDRGRLLLRRRGRDRRLGAIVDVGEEPLAVELVPGRQGAVWVVSTSDDIGQVGAVLARRISAGGGIGPELLLQALPEGTQEVDLDLAPDGRGGLFALVAVDRDTLDADVGGSAFVRAVHARGSGRVRRRRVVSRGRAARVGAALAVARGSARVVYSDHRSRRRSRRGVFVRPLTRRGRLGARRRLGRRGHVEGAAAAARGRRLHVLLSTRRGLSLARYRPRRRAVRLTRRSSDDEQIVLDSRGRAYVAWLALGCRPRDETDEPELSAYARVVSGPRRSPRRLVEGCA